ncbi:MAG: sulfurtransferase TusA family protein [Thiobacillus sp.]|nr:sulfurtransferase TusA family protein [Thiobacillus sp.]
MASDIATQLDVCGVCCPLPLIQLAKAVQELAGGQLLEITGNDPIFEPTVRDYCQVNGHTVLEIRNDAERRVTILIRVGG